MRLQVAKFLRLAVQFWNSTVKFCDKIRNVRSKKSKFRDVNFKILKFSLNKMGREQNLILVKFDPTKFRLASAANSNLAISKLAILKFSCLPRRRADRKC